MQSLPKQKKATYSNDPHSSNPVASKAMGIIDSFKHSRAESIASREVKKAELDAQKNEAIMTVQLIAKNNGATVRALHTQIAAQTFGAVVTETTQIHQAIALEQASARFAFHLANRDAEKEHLNAITKRFSDGSMNENDVQDAVNLAQNLQAQTEARINGMYHLGANAVDQLMSNHLNMMLKNQ